MPAIAAVIESLPADARGLAFLEVDSDADIQAIAAPAGVELVWLRRGGVPAGESELLVKAVRDAEWPEGKVEVFAHGERGYMKGLREVLFRERGLDAARFRCPATGPRAGWRTTSRPRRNCRSARSTRSQGLEAHPLAAARPPPLVAGQAARQRPRQGVTQHNAAGHAEHDRPGIEHPAGAEQDLAIPRWSGHT